MPILPTLVNQVVQIMNVSKANSDSANNKKVTKQVKENPEEQKCFFVETLVYGRLELGEEYHSNAGGCYCDRDETVSL